MCGHAFAERIERKKVTSQLDVRALGLNINRTLLKDLSLALLALGCLFLFVAVIAYFGGITIVGLVGGTRTDYPFRQYSGILLIGGIVSLVLGLGFLWRSKQEKSRYSDWKIISTFGLILGVLSLAGAFVAYFYSQLAGGPGFALYHVHPFRNYSLPLFLFGVVLLVIGFVTGQRGPRTSFYGSSTSLPDDTGSKSVPQRAPLTPPPTHIKKRISRKKILGVIVFIVLIVSTPFLYNTIYELVCPVTSITDVEVGYIQFSDYGLYTAYFRLMNSIHKWTASDGTVNIKIIQNNVILYDNTFKVYKSQFGKGTTWGGWSFSYYRWTFPSSDVPGLPSVLPDLVSDFPKNVTATINFTTPQGKTLTGTDDVWEFP